MSCYMYVDGESHYIRARECWKTIHGPDAELCEVASHLHDRNRATPTGNPWWTDIAEDWKAKLFYDARVLWRATQNMVPCLTDRRVYFTSFTGTPEELHAAQVKIRGYGLEPHVIPEQRKLANQRENLLNQTGVIEKAKGVDIGLSVQILEDAYHNNFTSCYLLTSDVDYLPVIEAMRRMGKDVYVLGYRDGLAARSPLEYVPDKFFDIGEDFMRKHYQREPREKKAGMA